MSRMELLALIVGLCLLLGGCTAPTCRTDAPAVGRPVPCNPIPCSLRPGCLCGAGKCG